MLSEMELKARERVEAAEIESYRLKGLIYHYLATSVISYANISQRTALYHTFHTVPHPPHPYRTPRAHGARSRHTQR